MSPLCFPPHPVNIEPIGPLKINEHWRGFRAPVDAAILGRAHVSPKPTQASPQPPTRRPSRRRKPSRRGKKGGRYRRYSLFDDLLGNDDWFDSYTNLHEKSTPAQKVYFFKGGMNTWSCFYPEVRLWKYLLENRNASLSASPFNSYGLCVSVLFLMADKYYRVNLQTQRVDSIRPPYPRSIAKYWLGCKHEEKPDISKAEKRWAQREKKIHSVIYPFFNLRVFTIWTHNYFWCVTAYS